MTERLLASQDSVASGRLPLGSLVALSSAAFLAIITEALPAGILPAMSSGLGVSEAAAGQTVTVFALGSVLAAIPLTRATTEWPRKRVLLLALGGSLFVNTVTAVSQSYLLTMTVRFLGGVAAGLLWSLMAGYARRLVSPEQRGRATAVALMGIPVALSLGVPVGTGVANEVGWRYTLAIVSGLTIALLVWVIVVVPDFPGTPRQGSFALRRVVALPGILPVMVTALAFVLAHNVLYTYIAPFLAETDLSGRVDVVLLVFGTASVLSIWATGILIDRRLRSLVILMIILFAAAALGLALLDGFELAIFVSSALWGLSFGGAAPLLQTAAAEAAGDDAVDVTQSLLVTTWNIGIAGGASLGGILLSALGTPVLVWGPLVLALLALAIAVGARDHGFPSLPRRTGRLQS